MIRTIQIEGEVVAMFAKEENGKVTRLDMRVIPLPMWNKHYCHEEILQP